MKVTQSETAELINEIKFKPAHARNYNVEIYKDGYCLIAIAKSNNINMGSIIYYYDTEEVIFYDTPKNKMYEASLRVAIKRTCKKLNIEQARTKAFINKHFLVRDNETTNIKYCYANNKPSSEWVECDFQEPKESTCHNLHVEKYTKDNVYYNIQFWGWL